MNITFEKLTELSFDSFQAAELTLLASESSLKIVCDNYNKFIALGFDNAQIIKLATQTDGAALSIILKHADQFEVLYSAKFTVADIVGIATIQPNNLEVLFENLCFVNFNETLSVKKFIECLSGNESDVDHLIIIIKDMLLSLLPEAEQTTAPETTVIIEHGPCAKRPKITKTTDAFTGSSSTTTGLQRIFTPPIGYPEPQPNIPEAAMPASYIPMQNNTSWFISRSTGTQNPVTNLSSEDLIFHDTVKNHIAVVIRPDQLDTIQTDDANNIFIVKNNLRLLMLSENVIREKESVFEIVNRIHLCVDVNDNFIGVVFNSNPLLKPRFPDCKDIAFKTFTNWIGNAQPLRKQKLVAGLKIAQAMCATILEKVNIEYKTRNTKTMFDI